MSRNRTTVPALMHNTRMLQSYVKQLSKLPLHWMVESLSGEGQSQKEGYKIRYHTTGIIIRCLFHCSPSTGALLPSSRLSVWLSRLQAANASQRICMSLRYYCTIQAGTCVTHELQWLAAHSLNQSLTYFPSYSSTCLPYITGPPSAIRYPRIPLPLPLPPPSSAK